MPGEPNGASRTVGIVRVLLWSFDPANRGDVVTPALGVIGDAPSSVVVESIPSDAAAGTEPTVTTVPFDELDLTLQPNTTVLLTFVP